MLSRSILDKERELHRRAGENEGGQGELKRISAMIYVCPGRVCSIFVAAEFRAVFGVFTLDTVQTIMPVGVVKK